MKITATNDCYKVVVSIKVSPESEGTQQSELNEVRYALGDAIIRTLADGLPIRKHSISRGEVVVAE